MRIHGLPPYLECSSAGDKRFSAFYAKIRGPRYNGRTIESIYQGAKIFPDGSTNLSWQEAKGRKPVNLEYCTNLYRKLWRLYVKQNPELLEVLALATGLTDKSGSSNGGVCQATELWLIREEYLCGRVGV